MTANTANYSVPGKIGFIGLGLIGGSIAKAVRMYYPDCQLIAFDQNKESLTLALQDDTIDIACSEIDHNFRDCTYLFLCAPVSCNASCLHQLKDHISSECIITDVGSVKTPIHEEAASLNLDAQFIGGHPMTGSEKSGFINAKAHLIENAYYLITPSSRIPEKKMDEFRFFIESLHAIPLVLDYAEHDYITGAISHLPHILASCLVNFVRNADNKENLMKRLAAGGFKDITRIASSSPVMWQQICLKNKENISAVLGEYIETLRHTKDAIDNGKAQDLYTLFETSRDYRNSIPDSSSGPIKKQFALYCDIVDETGGIAAIATILADNDISIKNIGIIHNREFEEGVLRIEFYEETASVKAAELLQKYHYTVYET